MDQQNQQQTVHPAQPDPATAKFNVVDIIVKILPVLTIVFIVLAAVSLLYNFILGIVAWAQTGRFIQFIVSGIEPAVQRCGFNVFAAAVLTGICKIIKK